MIGKTERPLIFEVDIELGDYREEQRVASKAVSEVKQICTETPFSALTMYVVLGKLLHLVMRLV